MTYSGRPQAASARWHIALFLLVVVAMTSACSHHQRHGAPAAGLGSQRPFADAAYAIDAGDVRSCMRQSPACAAVGAQIPAMLIRSESATRLMDRALFEAEIGAVERWLDAQPSGDCPALSGSLAYVRAMCGDLRRFFDMMHDADQPASADQTYGNQSAAARLQAFVAMHDQAVARAPLDTLACWDAWRREGDEVPEVQRVQRFLINAATDPFVVHEDGSVGTAQQANAYPPLVQTPALPELSERFVVLQGQGPRTADSAAHYAQTAMAFAVKQRVRHVWFVNVAGGQVPSFADAVAQASRSTVVDANYIEYDGWRDGTLVTPATAAAFAVQLADAMAATEKRGLLVVNCNAGLDRSGTVNALVQLVLWSRQQLAAGQSKANVKAGGHDAIDVIVAHLKQARAHSISSPGRFLFLHQAFEAFIDGVPPKA